MENQSKGSLQDIAGKVQDSVGSDAGDAILQKRVAGQLQQSYGEALDIVRENSFRNPIATVAAVAGVVF